MKCNNYQMHFANSRNRLKDGLLGRVGGFGRKCRGKLLE